MAALEGKQIVIVVGQKNYNEKEFQYLFETLENEGADVCVASNTLEKALGRLEGYVTPDCTIADLNPEEFDALILVGGYGARVYLWDDPDTHEAVRRFVESGKVVGAISTAPVVLAKAGVLRGRRATGYPDYESTLAMQDGEAHFVHENVVVDDNIITCSHSRFVEDFATALIQKLKGT